MELETLGRTGVQVSRYCLGTMMFGAMGNTDHDDCVRIIHAALDAGINFIDTADVYSMGESEEIVGKALKGRRDQVVLATKFFHPMPEGPGGASRRWIIAEVERSLRRLHTDHLDLYQQHRFSSDTAMEETLSALSDLVHQGKVRMLGCSSFPPERVVESHWIADRLGLERFRCEQPPYSLFTRSIERSLLPTCGRYGMGVIVWSPLDGGWLTGRYRAATDFDDESRLVQMGKRLGGFDPAADVNRRKLELVAELEIIAAEAGIRLVDLAHAFVLEHPNVTSAIIGPRTMEQLESSLQGADVRLDTDTLDAIDGLLAPGIDVNPMELSAPPAELATTHRRRPARTRT